MVGAWKSDHILAWFLKGLVELHIFLYQVSGGDHGNDVQQNIRVLLENKRNFLLDGLLKASAVGFGDAIPQFGTALVVIVN